MPVPLVTTLVADPSQAPLQVSSPVVDAVITGPSGTVTVTVVVHKSVPLV